MARRGRRNRSQAQQTPASNVAPYWLQFPGFVPNPNASVSKEFERLAEHMGWQGEEHRERKGEAYEADFDFHYTESGAKDRLAVWQGLCKEVELGEIPASINKCKEALKAGGVMVNIVNLIDRRRNPHTPLLKFTDFGKFRKYTKLYPYPKEKAKKDGYIRVLLRHVW